MKRMLFGFVAGVAVGVFGHWFLQQEEGKRAVAEARERMSAGAEKAKEVVLHGVDEIKEELLRTGRVVREKATGSPATGGTNSNTATVAAIRTRIHADAAFTRASIEVESRDGVVTLSGTATDYEQIGRAMKLSLETPGVQRVVSLVQVSSSR